MILSMPLAAPRPCTSPGCPNLVRGGGRCEGCGKRDEKADRDRRGSSAERGYGSKWQAFRLKYLADHPLCVLCAEEKPPKVTAATVVDHIKAHKGDQILFWDLANLRPLCKPHHDRIVSEGDFGRPPAPAGAP